jgi:hypothetical protein
MRGHCRGRGFNRAFLISVRPGRPERWREQRTGGWRRLRAAVGCCLRARHHDFSRERKRDSEVCVAPFGAGAADQALAGGTRGNGARRGRNADGDGDAGRRNEALRRYANRMRKPGRERAQRTDRAAHPGQRYAAAICESAHRAFPCGNKLPGCDFAARTQRRRRDSGEGESAEADTNRVRRRSTEAQHGDGRAAVRLARKPWLAARRSRWRQPSVTESTL